MGSADRRRRLRRSALIGLSARTFAKWAP